MKSFFQIGDWPTRGYTGPSGRFWLNDRIFLSGETLVNGRFLEIPKYLLYGAKLRFQIGRAHV